MSSPDPVDKRAVVRGKSPTPDLVELAREAFETTNLRDLGAVMSFYAPDAVWEVIGLGTSFRFAQLSTWVDGVVVWITGYNDIDEARAAILCWRWPAKPSRQTSSSSIRSAARADRHCGPPKLQSVEGLAIAIRSAKHSRERAQSLCAA
jgi:hypothetical protein